MFSSIRQKLILTFLALLLIITIPSTLFLQEYTKQFYISILKDQLIAQGKILASLFQAEDFQREDFEIINTKLNNIVKDIATRTTIINKKGTVLGDTHQNYKLMENHSDRIEVQEALKGEIGFDTRFSETIRRNMFYLAIPVTNGGEVEGIVRVAVPITEIEKAHNQTKGIIYSISAILFILGILFSLITARTITTPIEKINLVARKIADGKFGERVDIKTSDEIGQLSVTINRMAKTIEENINAYLHINRRLELILDSLDSGVILLNSKGKIELANPATYKIIGKKQKDVLSKTLIEVLRETQLHDTLLAAIKEKNSKSTQFSLNDPINKIIQASFVPIFEGDNVLKIVGVFYDITSLKEVEKIRTQFVANASHELQTPLTAVKGFTETLLDGAMYDPATLKKFLLIIDKEATRLQKIINGLLKLSLLESEKRKFIFTSLDLSSMLNETTSALEQKAIEASLDLQVEIPPRKTEVLGDQDLLPQAFFNLLDNAIKYTPPGGKIKVSLFEELYKIIIIIEDTGIGIPAEDLSRIFERFYRVDKARSRAKGGTGLGLAIVKHIIDAHNGSIKVSSKLDHGTTFIIELPKQTELK